MSSPPADLVDFVLSLKSTAGTARPIVPPRAPLLQWYLQSQGSFHFMNNGPLTPAQVAWACDDLNSDSKEILHHHVPPLLQNRVARQRERDPIDPAKLPPAGDPRNSDDQSVEGTRVVATARPGGAVRCASLTVNGTPLARPTSTRDSRHGT